ncbi:restriction endonuclease subunit S, partial [Ruminococcus intestinalis]|uniref:restriction endonuclease subunit S n=1 Tax=Ruminococcus intestinalis TaxID=2763066 RepID=UPI003F8121DB
GDEVRSLADEVPFDIPDSWEWVRLGSIVYNRGQITPNTDFCYIDIGSIDNKNQKLNSTDTIITPDKAPSRARKLVSKGDILYSTVRPYLHNMCIIDRDFSCAPIASTGFAALTCHADLLNKYLFYYMMSPDFDAYANNTDNAKGVAYPAINDDRLYKALIPIPPLGEQLRIVSAIESVDMPIRDYGVKEKTLRTLNVSFPEALKKSILQKAVQGKLVPQDPSDEPAEALLERIRAEKQRLIKEGKIKKDKHESVIFRRDNSHYEKRGSEEVCIDDEIPFEIPENWAWARLSSFGVFSSGKTPSMSNPQFWNGNIPWVTSKDMKRPVITDSEMHISVLAASSMQLYPAGTLLLVARSGILKRLLPLCKLGIDSTINQDIKAFSLYDIELSEWLFYGIKAFEPYILKELVKSVTTVESLKFDEFSAMLIPVPPLSEQRRIIAAIKTAMNLLTPLSSNPLFSL